MEIRNRLWVGLGVVVAASIAFYLGTSAGSTGMDHGDLAEPEGARPLGMNPSVIYRAAGQIEIATLNL